MAEPKSSATIRALADLAELSATQLEEGHSVESVIEILRKAALSVRSVLEPEDEKPESDLTPVDLKEELQQAEDISA